MEIFGILKNFNLVDNLNRDVIENNEQAKWDYFRIKGVFLNPINTMVYFE